ncbi:MAG: STAS domain-containing protein [Candidatus Eiseniibacteriota bacterium]
MPRQMTLSCETDGDSGRTQVVRLAGRMDALGGTEVWDDVSPRVSAEKPNLLLDMTGVQYLSSAGITTLIQLLNRVKPLGGKLAIFGCNATLRRVFRVVALEPILNVCDTLEEARARVG